MPYRAGCRAAGQLVLRHAFGAAAGVGIIKADPGVQNVMGFTGGQGATNGGSIYMALKPLNVRKASAQQIIARLRPSLARVVGANVFLQAAQDIRVGGRQSNAGYQYALTAQTNEQLQRYGPLLLAGLKQAPGFTDVNTDQQNDGLQTLLTYDASPAARLGVTPQLLDNTLYDAFGQAEVSTIYTELNQYHVVMEAAPRFWASPAGLDNAYLVNSPAAPGAASGAGGAVPLSAVTHYIIATSPLVVNHTGLFPSATVSFNLAPGVSLSQATQRINTIERQLDLPAAMRGEFAGTLQAYQQSLASEPYLVATAILAVYIVLGILYESLVHPLTILSTLPPASVGAVLALQLTGSPLDVMSIIGIILLIAS